jgi:REP element-mobilizing transposase RayT
MELNRLGQIALQSWIGIPEHFAHVNLHAFVTMPNHVHGIIEIGCQAGAQHAAPLQEVGFGEICRHRMAPGSLSSIVRSFKAAVTARARKELDWKGEVWQRNYFERTLRDGPEFSDASRYISENPMKSEQDRENPKSKQAVEPKVKGAQYTGPLLRKI